MNKKIRILIIDDSKLIRELLSQIFSTDDSLEVVATAEDPYDAREKIKKYQPDVLTLDIEMPKMDGITFLSNLMRLRPMPVVMVSTLTQKGADITLKALSLGAVDYFAKPTNHVSDILKSYGQVIISKVKGAAEANVSALTSSNEFTKSKSYSIQQLIKSPVKMIAIGASTGGTEAIKNLLMGLPNLMPPIVIVQHIPPVFSASYAVRLDDIVELSVQESNKSAVPLQNGRVYIAPGDRHLMVRPNEKGWKTLLKDGNDVNRHKPSVDVLFESVCEHVGDKAIGVMLTGMGKDGSKQMKALHDSGAYTIAQDKNSSVVWGMPGAAHEIGAVEEVLPLSKIADRLLELVYGKA